MTRAVRSYSIGWPAGYPGRGVDQAKLTAHEKRDLASRRGAVIQAQQQVTTTMRHGGLEALPKGRGTIGSLAQRSDADSAKVERLRRGRAL